MRILSQIVGLLVAVFLLFDCWRPLNSNSDFWAHAAVGRWIVSHGEIPRHALFLWTYSGPWIAHSWLAEIGCFELMRIGGDLGGAVLAASLSAMGIVAAFVFALYPVLKTRRFPLSAAWVVMLAVVAATWRFVARPDICTLLFVALVYFVFERVWSRPERRGAPILLVGIPALYALWTNLHGGVLFGLAALWLGAVCELVQFRDRTGRLLVVAAALATVALAANPYGLAYLSVFSPVASHSFRYINEWKPIWSAPIFDARLQACEFAAIGLAASAWALCPTRRWAGLAWLILGTASFVDARRNMDLAAITALSVFASHYAGAASSPVVQRLIANAGRPGLPRALHMAAAVGVLSWLIVLCVQVVGAQTQRSFVDATVAGVSWRQSEFLSKFGLGNRRVLNPYNASPYLEWSLGERVPLSIDNLNAYPQSLFDDWEQMWSATPEGLALLDKLKIDCVIGEALQPGVAHAPLYGYLFGSPEWTEVYDGGDGAVFVRTRSLPSASSPKP
jgi:hypothetical protein